jgi:1-deoxy-D-xylulose-5-phosphate reductoisomerase
MIKIIAHDTTMEIPIFNSIYADKKKVIKTNKINIQKLNNLNFKKIDYKKFPSVRLLNHLPLKDSLFETALVTINDKLVNLFLEGKIKYDEVNVKMNKILNRLEIKLLKKKLPSTISNVINTHKFINFKINSFK